MPLGVALGCVLAWSVALTLQQALFEPLPKTFIATYGARDVRVALTVLAALTAVWARRGDRRSGWFAFTGGVGWLVLDVLLDRAEVAGGYACAGLAIGGAVLVSGLWWLGARSRSGAPSTGRLLVAAVVAAAIAGSGYWIHGVGDIPRPWPMLWPLILAGLGVVVMSGCLLATGPERGRALRAAGCGALAFLGVAGAALRAGWLLALTPAVHPVATWPWAQLWGFALPSFVAAYLGIAYGGPMMLLLTVVAALAWNVRGWRGYLGTALGVFMGWAVFATVFMTVWVDLLVRYDEWLVGDWLTAQAGNPPGHDPQSYTPSLYLAVAIALGMTCFLLAVRSVLAARHRTPEPVPADTSRCDQRLSAG